MAGNSICQGCQKPKFTPHALCHQCRLHTRGYCAWCGRESGGKSLCERHLAVQRERNRRYRAEAQGRGVPR